MNYIYHGVPSPMIGTKLVPLNKMPRYMSEIHSLHLSKYKGREEILNRKVPLLDCLWNDVVQFVPFNPRKIFELQVELKLISKVPDYKFFEINLDVVDPKKTVVFFKNRPGEENIIVKWIDDIDFEQIQEIPQATINYFKSMIGAGEPPLNYQFVPHIVHKGTVEISNSKIITL